MSIYIKLNICDKRDHPILCSRFSHIFRFLVDLKPIYYGKLTYAKLENEDEQECLEEDLRNYRDAKLFHLVTIFVSEFYRRRRKHTEFNGGQTLVHDDFVKAFVLLIKIIY